MIPNKIFVNKDSFGFIRGYHIDGSHPPHGEEYLRKDAVVSTIKDYLANWLDAYKIERLIDKIEKL